MHSGVHGPALTYPRFSKQKVMPPSPTIISPAFNRSRMVPFYERSKEITPNWIILPIRRTEEKGDSERSDEKRNAFFILFYFFSRYTSSACSTLRARLALASTRVKNAKRKKRLPHLPLPHHFSNGSSLCEHSNPFRGEIESMFWRPRREPLGRSEGILPPPWNFSNFLTSFLWYSIRYFYHRYLWAFLCCC